MVRKSLERLRAAASPSRWNDRSFRRRAIGAGLAPVEFDLPHGRMHAWVGGEGPPLVLLHGFGSDGMWQFHAQVGPLAKKHRLIIPDLLHFGASVASRQEFSPEFQAEAVLDLLDVLGVHRADALGVSYGGLVAWALAINAPQRVRRLVLVDSPGSVFSPSDLARLLVEHQVEHIADLLLPVGGAAVQRLLGLAWHRPPRLPSFVLDDIHRFVFSDRRAEKRGVLDALIARIDDPSIRERLPHQSTLLIWGRHDRIFTVELGQRLQAVLRDRARLVVIEGAAHVPNTQRPRAFNRHVLGFLRG